MVDLMTRARAGETDAFVQLTTPFRRELHVHCYRMLGSFEDAEDSLQETLLSAWQSFGGFEGRSSLRTWLYQIATNKCLNARRFANRRPAKEWDIPKVQPPESTRLGEVLWLEPYPDSLLNEVINLPLGPEAQYEQSESITLAFITALQILPPRQLAVIVLRDVLGFKASETAQMLNSTLESVNSALKRARISLLKLRPHPVQVSSAPNSQTEIEIVGKFVRAWESADMAALIALLTHDVFISMPPMPFEYEGREAVSKFCASIFDSGRRFKLVPTRANGQSAFGTYVHDDDEACLFVLTLAGNQISAITRFESHVLPWFGLEPSLPSL